jgi:hypothetical protein
MVSSGLVGERLVRILAALSTKIVYQNRVTLFPFYEQSRLKWID